ncbi:MAG: hypothetical protein EOM68_11500 [Spirochaetia bacterium]|nr:hypothetical protein [Spirochaetia bacterium]
MEHQPADHTGYCGCPRLANCYLVLQVHQAQTAHIQAPAPLPCRVSGVQVQRHTRPGSPLPLPHPGSAHWEPANLYPPPPVNHTQCTHSATEPPATYPLLAGNSDNIRCTVCKSLDADDRMLLCDGCDAPYHTFCLRPKLRAVPKGDWFCTTCKLKRVASQRPPKARTQPLAVGQASPGDTGPTIIWSPPPNAAHVPPQAVITEPRPPTPPPIQAGDKACPLCNSHAERRTICCQGCTRHYHPQCLGLHATAYAASEFICAHCTLEANKVMLPSEKAAQAAHMLVYLKGNRIQTSSMDTYATAMHRYIMFCTEVLGLTMAQALPQGREGVIPTPRVELFIAAAASQYKVSTIRVTLSALADWHKSKGAPTDSVSMAHPSIKALMKSVATQQGPSGLPVGKQGLSKPMLHLLLAHIAAQRQLQPTMSQLHTRDIAWVLIGFFGLLRRSELIALNMQDIHLVPGPEAHIALSIRKSKTDQVGAGATVLITATSKDGVRIWDRLNDYVQLRKQQGTGPTDPLFPAWDLDTYTLSTHTRLRNGEALSTRLKGYLAAIRAQFPDVQVNPSSYGMHSLRRGGVVAAWQAGVDMERLKAHGRWRSDAVRTYMTANTAIKLSVTRAM